MAMGQCFNGRVCLAGSDSNRAMSAKGLAEALWGKGRYHPTVDNAMTLTWERSASFEGDCLLRVRILHSWGGNFQAGAALCWADASESFPAKTSKVSSDEMKQAVGAFLFALSVPLHNAHHRAFPLLLRIQGSGLADGGLAL